MTDTEELRRRVAELERELHECRQTVEVLRASEELNRRIIDQVPGGIVEIDRDGTIRRANREAQRILGLSDNEMARRCVADFEPLTFHEDGRPYPSSDYPVVKCLETGQAQPPVPIGVRRPDGSMSWAIYSAFPLVEPTTGATEGAVVTFFDITARKQAKMALAESEARLELALRTSNTGLWDADVSTGQVYYSPTWKRQLGHADHEVGNSQEEWRSRLHPDERAAILANLDRYFDSPWPNFEHEFRLRHRDGSYRWILSRAAAIRSADGQVLRMIGTQFDITERKQAEEALRESEEFHRVISELTSDYAYTCRAQPDGSFSLESVSAGFTRVTGYTLEEIKQAGDWPALIHPDDLALAYEFTPEFLSERRHIYELRLRTKSGATRWIRYSVYLVRAPASGQVVRLIGAVKDFTEEHQLAEERQEYARQLQALSRRLLEVQEEERRHLARELHDEIGQILTGLQLNLGLIGKPAGPGAPAPVDEARRLVRDLTTRVRDLSLRLRPTMLDDLGLRPALLWHFERYTAQTKVCVDFEVSGLDRRFPPDVETATYRIVQEALTNVARHAGVPRASVRVGHESSALHIRVADAGSGFDPGSVRATSRSSGLSGMQERALLLGGRLSVESRPGGGTLLNAVLPIPAETDEEEHDSLHSGRG